jgi:predicted TIM-barrel fold metal-dependent hydrolase
MPTSEPAEEMALIDVHVHALPRGEMCGGEVDARLPTVLQGLRAHGIGHAVLVPINDISWQPVDEMNDFTERAVREHAGLAGFIDLDLSRAHYAGGIRQMEADVTRRYENGLRGLKVHLQNLGVQADDWRLLPLYRLAGELGIPVMVHCHPGSCPGTVDNSSPVAIEKMVRAFHKTTFVISHFGGVLYLDYMPWLSHENVYFESSGVMDVLLRCYGVDRLRYVFEEIGYERIMFGSDYPTADLDGQIQAMRQVVPSAYQGAVFSETALRLGHSFGWWP